MEKKEKEIILMFIKGFLTLVINILLYVVLISYILNNLNSLLRRYNLPLSVDINQKELLLNLVFVFGVFISIFACVRSASPKYSVLKLVGIGLEILFTALFYCIFIVTGNSILLLGVKVNLSVDVILDISNILYVNFGLQLLKIGVLLFQVTEFILIKVEKEKNKQKPKEVNEQIEKNNLTEDET